MAPRKFSGPIQQGAIRVLRDMEVASTSDIMPITHPRQHNPQHRSRSLRRVLDEIAIRVGRADGQGTLEVAARIPKAHLIVSNLLDNGGKTLQAGSAGIRAVTLPRNGVPEDASCIRLRDCRGLKPLGNAVPEGVEA